MGEKREMMELFQEIAKSLKHIQQLQGAHDEILFLMLRSMDADSLAKMRDALVHRAATTEVPSSSFSTAIEMVSSVIPRDQVPLTFTVIDGGKKAD